MASTRLEEQDRRALGQQIEQAVSRLGQQTVSALIDHPLVLDSAIEAAARTISHVSGATPVEHFGSKAAEPLSYDDAMGRLDSRSKPIESDVLLGANEVATVLGVGSRQAVHARRERGQLLGFQNARRAVLYPREQFDVRGRVVPGLAEVLAVFDGDAFEAWTWLSTPSAALNGVRPLDQLWDEEIEAVVCAAMGYRQGDFG